jgi:hypothetical protein
VDGRFDDLEAQRSLGEKELQIFNAEMQRQQRSVAIAYLLWFFLGWAGVHKFYLGKVVQGIVYAVFGIGGLIAANPLVILALIVPTPEGQEPTLTALAGAAAIGLLALFVWGILMLWDLFTIPRQISRREAEIKRALLQRLRAPSSG